MIYFLCGIFVGIFVMPVIEALETLIEQGIQVKMAKMAKEIYTINQEIQEPEEEETHVCGFQLPPVTIDDDEEEEDD